jgi:orotidine-5'-phosphate decarboxylase
MDRLWEAVAEKGHVCVGLDTAVDYVPPFERGRAASDSEAVLTFNQAVIDATIDVAACYKVQIACYEERGLAGLKTYAETLSYLRARGALVIADIKRGDIADTALRYAKAHFAGDFEADFVTLSPYMGMDSIEPWLTWAESKGKGAFVLLRTSNKGMRDFEYLAIDQGETGRRNRRLYDVVGEKLSALAETHRGRYGYGVFGAVVGCSPKGEYSPLGELTGREEAAQIRERFSSLFFLIPGYGAQGGAADDVALLLKNGNGGVVNASRSILKAWAAPAGGPASLSGAASDKEASGSDPAPEAADNAFAARAAREAAISMRDAIRAAAGGGGAAVGVSGAADGGGRV